MLPKIANNIINAKNIKKNNNEYLKLNLNLSKKLIFFLLSVFAIVIESKTYVSRIIKIEPKISIISKPKVLIIN
jgi:Ca2+/Na+ antiporter